MDIEPLGSHLGSTWLKISFSERVFLLAKPACPISSYKNEKGLFLDMVNLRSTWECEVVQMINMKK